MLTSLIPLTLLAASANAALNPIVRKGSFLFDSGTGDRFYIKGVAYSANSGSSSAISSTTSANLTALDPLIDVDACNRDIANFKTLGLNAIRVYQVNATQDHSGCMAALDAAGIYVLLDLATPDEAIASDAPAWNTELFDSFIETIEAFHNYTNVFGFNVGNEVINNVTQVPAAPFIKAAVRDVKSYISEKGYTQLVGYTATDDPSSRVNLPFYLGCESVAESIDYWGINIYEWCGDSNFVASGYAARTAELADLGIPAFFSEFGCDTVSPRPFTEVQALYSSNMTGVWTGGFAYEYFNESNNFGLGTLNPDGTFTTNQDFTNLKNQLALVSPTSLAMASYTPSISEPVSCPTQNASWPASTNLPPVPNAAACSCVVGNLSCTATSSALSSAASVGADIGLVCGETGANCTSVGANGTSGVYGALSMCPASSVLDIVLDAYWEGQNRVATACDFGGIAELNTAGKPGSAPAVQSSINACFSLAAQVSSAAATSTGPTKSGSSGSGGKNAAMHVGAPVNAAALSVGIATLLAFAGFGGMAVLF